MKKAVLILAALLVFSTLTFAMPNISFGTWGRTILTLAKGTTNPASPDIITQWGPEDWQPCQRLELTFTSDPVDYHLKANPAVGELWGFPNMVGTLRFVPNLLTVKIGQITGDGYDEFRKAGPQRDLANDNVGRMAGSGVWIIVAPKDMGLVAAAFYKIPSFKPWDSYKVVDVVQATMFAASYTIPDTAKITAGSCTSGSNPATDLIRNIFGRVELLMIKGLTLWLDVKFDGLESETINANRNIKALVSAGYNLDPLTINFATKFTVQMPKAGGDSTMELYLWPEVLYKINDDFTIGLDLYGHVKIQTGIDNGIDLEFEPLLKLTKFNATLSAKITMSTLAGSFVNWRVPLVVDFSFW